MKPRCSTALATATLLAALAPSPAGAASRPRYGGEVAVALPGPLVQTDPALAEEAADLFVSVQLHQPPLGRDASGALVPVLLTRIPQPEDGGRTFRLELRPGLRFHDGSAITARGLADSISRLGDPALRSPHAALALPLATVKAVSATEVEVRLAFPYPRWVELLAEPALAVTAPSAGGRTGCGPFALSLPRGEVRLSAFAGHAAGRPYLDTLVPVRSGSATPVGATAPWLSTYLFVSRSRPDARALAAHLDAALDREELVASFVPGGAAVPQSSLLPPPLDPLPPSAPARGPSRFAPGQLVLVYDVSAPGHRAVAERIQLRLHEAGLEARLEATSGRDLRERLAARRYDLALARTIAPADPGLALAAPLILGGERETATLALRDPRIVRGDPEAALLAARSRAASFRGAVPIVPLYAVPIAAGLVDDRTLRIPETAASALAPSLADAFLAPEPAAP